MFKPTATWCDGMTHDCSFLSDLDLEGAVSFDDSARESHAADWVT